MEMELLIALVSAVLSFMIFLKVFSYLNRIFNIEIPDFVSFIIMLLIVGGLYFKRGFFFGYNPIITGVTIGTMLALLWDIKETGFISNLLRVFISFRFAIWGAAAAIGIYKREIILNLLNKFILDSLPGLNPYILTASVILWILGSILLFYPQFNIRSSSRNSGFTMGRRPSKSKMLIAQVVGFILVLVFSTFLLDAGQTIYSFIYKIP